MYILTEQLKFNNKTTVIERAKQLIKEATEL